MLWFWLVVGPALALAALSLGGERRRAAYVRRRLSKTANDLPAASVIVPVKGMDEGLRQNLAALAALDYPDYELLIVAHSASDVPPGVLPPQARVILAHGRDPRTSEKVQNLTTAVHATRHRSQVFAFADSDGCVAKGWLRALVAPLAEEGVGASTGYRWFTPDRVNLWTLLRSVWDAVTAGLLGPGDNRFAWGGAMAIRRETFFETAVLRNWKGTVSDDYALSAAIHTAGLTIAYAPGALVPSRDRTSAPALFAWMRRQLMITRAYDPRQWRLGLAAHVLYCAAMAASVMAIWFGHRLGWWTLAAQLIPGMLKGALRCRLAAAALPESGAWFRRFGWTHWALVPLATWIWLIALVSSGFGCTIEWRGRRYDLKSHAASQRV